MRLPHIREAIHGRRAAAIHSDLSAIAVDTMRELMTNAPAAQRFQAARWVLEEAGHGQHNKQAEDPLSRPISQLSQDELAQALQAGMSSLRELAGQLDGHHIVDGQARPVRVLEPAEEPTEEPAEELDFLD